jgi:quercetin dioxygenase-like cupin family protein
MLASVEQLGFILDVAPLRAQLDAHPELWGQQSARKMGAHHQMTDIWARYRDPDVYRAQYGDDMSHFCDEHESVWLPPADLLPSTKIFGNWFARWGASDLGGVLLTKLAPGGVIDWHEDSGWHAEVHNKFYVAVKNPKGAVFEWKDRVVKAKDGEVYQFRNDIPHRVVNDSDEERIAMIICLRPKNTVVLEEAA